MTKIDNQRKEESVAKNTVLRHEDKVERKEEETAFTTEMIHYYKYSEKKNLADFHNLLISTKKDKRVMLEKLETVVKNWNELSKEIKMRKIQERRNKGVKAKPRFHDILYIQPFEPYIFKIRDIMKKRIKRRIGVNKNRGNLVERYVKFMELVDLNLTEIKKQSSKSDISEIVEGFERQQSKEIELYKKLYDVKTEVELLEAKSDKRNAEIIEVMEEIGKRQEENLIERKELDDRVFKIKSMGSK